MFFTLPFVDFAETVCNVSLFFNKKLFLALPTLEIGIVINTNIKHFLQEKSIYKLYLREFVFKIYDDIK